MAWTDEKLGERFDRLDERFEHVDERFEHLEARIDERFGEVNERIDSLAVQTRELARGMSALHLTLHRGSIGVVLALMGVIGAILARGG